MVLEEMFIISKATRSHVLPYLLRAHVRHGDCS